MGLLPSLVRFQELASLQKNSEISLESSPNEMENSLQKKGASVLEKGVEGTMFYSEFWSQLTKFKLQYRGSVKDCWSTQLTQVIICRMT